MARRFWQVDVFGRRPLAGNPLAVVVEADDLATEDMQALARWTNLSETTFLLPATTAAADYRVRIFTPAGELPFAGHPTLGSAWVWTATSGVEGTVVQECAAGLVPVRPSGGGLAFAAPPTIRSGPASPAEVDRVCAVLGVADNDVEAVEWVDNGPGWVAVLLADAGAVLAVEPDESRDPGSGPLEIGLVGFHPSGSEHAYEVRALFSDVDGTLREDPVTGSLNASVAQWLIRSGRVEAPYLVRQGGRLGRDGVIAITQEAGDVWVGGAVHGVIKGTIDLS